MKLWILCHTIFAYIKSSLDTVSDYLILKISFRNGFMCGKIDTNFPNLLISSTECKFTVFLVKVIRVYKVFDCQGLVTGIK